LLRGGRGQQDVVSGSPRWYRSSGSLDVSGSLRHGDGTIATDIAAFINWGNAECSRLGRTNAIPPDPYVLSPSRFRCTLAWFIRRRPRGLIAASIQYGNAYVRMTKGYADSYKSGFPDECAYEDYLFRLEALAEDAQALTDGERVSGPACERYRSRVTAASAKFVGRVIVRERRARDLVGNPQLQIHHGKGMTCVFNPSPLPTRSLAPPTTPWLPPTSTTAAPPAPTSPTPPATSTSAGSEMSCRAGRDHR